MKVTLERSTLLKSLGHVQRVVERRNTIPILDNVLIKTAKNNVTLKATDLDIEVTETLPADTQKDGATTVGAHTLYDITRKLPEGAEITMNLKDNALNVVCGKSKFDLQALAETDFPDLTATEFAHSFEMDAKELKGLIDKTQFAISTEETRYYLNGIYLHAVDNKILRAVATDGHRLARTETKAPKGAEKIPGVIVPRKTVGELQKLLEENEEKVKVEVSETKIRFTIDGVVLTSKLIDGTFPDYERVIPSNNDKEFVVDKETFANAVDRVSTISTDRGRAMKITLNDGKAVLTANNPESGSAQEEISGTYKADELEIGFNSGYLLDITTQLQNEQTVFMFADPGSPALIRDKDVEHTLYVLMPMRV